MRATHTRNVTAAVRPVRRHSPGERKRGPRRRSAVTPVPGIPRGSDRADVLRLGALLALRDVELDLLALVEGLVALRDDGGVVAEDVGAAAVLGDEPEALLRVEPLHSALSHAVSHSVLGVSGPADCRSPGRRTDRQDREERQAETTADVQERSRGTTATGGNPTRSRAAWPSATSWRADPHPSGAEFGRPTAFARRCDVVSSSRPRVGQGP